MKIEARVPPVHTHPWLLRRGHREPYDEKYYRKFGDARKRVIDDLNGFENKLKLLSSDAIRRIAKLRDQARRMYSGGVIEGEIDWDLGVRYRAELIRRQEMS